MARWTKQGKVCAAERRESKGEGEARKRNRDQSCTKRKDGGTTHFVALFCSFQGLPLVLPAEDWASSRGAEVVSDGVVVVDIVGL